MKRLLLAPIFLFLLGGCGFNPENAFSRNVVVESSNRDKYIVKDSSVEIQKYFNKYDYLELILKAQINSILVKTRDPVIRLLVENQRWELNNNFPKELNSKTFYKYVRDYFNLKDLSELETNAHKEMEIARDSLEGNHAILINFQIIYKPFYENKAVIERKKRSSHQKKESVYVCLNPKLKDETYKNWTRYYSVYNSGESYIVSYKEDFFSGNPKNESDKDFVLDMEVLKKKLCEKYAKF